MTKIGDALRRIADWWDSPPKVINRLFGIEVIACIQAIFGAAAFGCLVVAIWWANTQTRVAILDCVLFTIAFYLFEYPRKHLYAVLNRQLKKEGWRGKD